MFVRFLRILCSFALFTAFATKVLAANPIEIKNIDGKVQIQFDPRLMLQTVPLNIIFVIDNSQSMAYHQQRLIDSLPYLVKYLENVPVFNAVVINTDADRFSNDTWIDTTDANWLENLKTAIKNQGVDGSFIEQPFATVLHTINNPANANRWLPNSYLAVVMLTDAEDQSPMSSESFIAELIAKQGSADRVGVYGLVIPAGASTSKCPTDGGVNGVPRIETAIQAFNGVEANLCDIDLSRGLQDIGSHIFSKINSQPQTAFHIPAGYVPSLVDTHVNYGSHMIPAGDIYFGWTYNSITNEFILGEHIDWTTESVGTKVIIDFIPADWL